jgi:hypothetical protein
MLPEANTIAPKEVTDAEESYMAELTTLALFPSERKKCRDSVERPLGEIARFLYLFSVDIAPSIFFQLVSEQQPLDMKRLRRFLDKAVQK